MYTNFNEGFKIQNNKSNNKIDSRRQESKKKNNFSEILSSSINNDTKNYNSNSVNNCITNKNENFNYFDKVNTSQFDKGFADIMNNKKNMRNTFLSQSKSQILISTTTKGSSKLNADIESSLNNQKFQDIKNLEEDSDMSELKVAIKSNNKSHESSYSRDKFTPNRIEKNQNHILQTDNKISRNSFIYDKTYFKESRNVLKKNPNENLNNNHQFQHNLHNSNSLNSEKFDRSYTSLITRNNHIYSAPQNQKSILTNNSNYFIKSNKDILDIKVRDFGEIIDAYNNKNSDYFHKDNNNPSNLKNNLNKKFKEFNNELIKIKENATNFNDGMFVTSTVINGESKEETISKMNLTSRQIFSRKEEKLVKNIIGDFCKNNLNNAKEGAYNNNLMNKDYISNQEHSKEEEIMVLNKIIENEINRRNQKINYCGLGSQYNKICSFDLKFNREMGKISRNYGKIESKQKFVNKDQYDELIQEVKDFESFRNIKILNEKSNHRFKLMPLINNKKNSLGILANNFFLNLKSQKEHPDYVDINQEFDNYFNNKNEEEKYKSLFDEDKENK